MQKEPQENQTSSPPPVTSNLHQSTEDYDEDQLNSLQISHVKASYSGPLPPPAAFKQYEEVQAGTAKRILDMAERQQDHRIKWETESLNASTRYQILGQVFGLISVFSCVVGSCYLATIGQTWPAIALAGASMISVVRAFIERRKAD